MRTALFFVEPAPFHGNPMLFKNKVDMISRLADLHGGNCNISIITSPQLSRTAGDNIDYKFDLPVDFCLRGYDYDLARYSLDICRSNIFIDECNNELLGALRHADDIVHPARVISFTENAYLRHVFGDRCVFSEVSPIPRWFTEPSLFFDPFGFQFDNAVKRYVDGQSLQAFDETFSTAFEDYWQSPVRSWSESIGMVEWVNSFKADSKVLVLALQPAKDINYLGSGIAGDDIALVRRAASTLPSDFKILCFWHPASDVPEQSLLDELQESYPQLAVPPEHLRKGQAEAALIHADAVAGVSSNLLFLGAVLGLEVHVFASSRFACLSKFNSKTDARRLDLLAFVTEYYSMTEAHFYDSQVSLLDKIDLVIEELHDYRADRRISNENTIKKFLHFAAGTESDR